MKFEIIAAPQGSAEWFKARLCRVTGSKADAVLSKIKTGESAARRDYKIQLIAEHFTGQVAENFVTKDMQWGVDNEPLARMAYEAKTGHMVRETGFLKASDIMAGASLDGDINGFEGIIEIKCPKSATHIKWLLEGKAPADYMPQITHNLWISGAAWCDFVSSDPRLPEHLQLFTVRVMRESVDFDAHKTAVLQFLDEVQAMISQLEKVAA